MLKQIKLLDLTKLASLRDAHLSLLADMCLGKLVGKTKIKTSSSSSHTQGQE